MAKQEKIPQIYVSPRLDIPFSKLIPNLPRHSFESDACRDQSVRDWILFFNELEHKFLPEIQNTLYIEYTVREYL